MRINLLLFLQTIPTSALPSPLSNKKKKKTAAYKAERALKKQLRKERQLQTEERLLQAAETQRLFEEHQADMLLLAADSGAELDPTRNTLLRRLTKKGLNPNAPAAPVKETISFKKFFVNFQLTRTTAAVTAVSPDAKVTDVCEPMAKAGGGSSNFDFKVKKALNKTKAFIGSCFAAPTVRAE